MVMWKMVLLFRCLVVCTNLLQYCQTTRQQNNKTTKRQICLEDSTFQHSEKESRDKNRQLYTFRPRRFLYELFWILMGGFV